MESEAQFMQKAIQLSREHMQKGHGGPFGAIVVKDGKIIGEGWNKVTSSNDPTAHAEVEAIRQACKTLNTFELRGCEIFTSCEPCPMCLSAIYWARIDKIFYANTKKDAAAIQFDDDFIYREISKSLNERAIPTHQLLADQAIQVFKEWENKTDKIKY
jgi:guanine deaminase